MDAMTLRLVPRARGWSVLRVDGDEPARDFLDLDAALRWCVAQRPAAIRLPDDLFVPTEQGPGLELAGAHPFSPARA